MNKHKLKMAFLVWVSIYPLITFVFVFFGQYLPMLPLLLRTLVLTLFLVPTMVFVLLPFWTKVAKRLFKNW
jgi:antibiotic biosynthesis monooxygenase (ABM) superfamily enzyme